MMANEELDDEIEKVAKQDVHDAETEYLQKARKKSAFNTLAQQELQLVKTDVDTKTKKKGPKKHDDEDELSKVDKQIVSPEEIRDIELAAEKRRHRNFQEGGSSSSKQKKRDASKSPETLRYDEKEDDVNHKLSKIEIKRNEVYERALTNGAKIEHHPTFGAWKMEMGKKKGTTTSTNGIKTFII